MSGASPNTAGGVFGGGVGDGVGVGVGDPVGVGVGEGVGVGVGVAVGLGVGVGVTAVCETGIRVAPVAKLTEMGEVFVVVGVTR